MTPARHPQDECEKCTSKKQCQETVCPKELFRKEIAKWKDEDPLFMAYVHGQESVASRTIPPAPEELHCDKCRFVKDCSLLYFPPCEKLARRDEQHYREAAKAERERVFVALRKEISDRFHLKPRPYDPNDQEIPQIGIDELAEIFDAAEESLRQPEPQQEERR